RASDIRVDGAAPFGHFLRDELLWQYLVDPRQIEHALHPDAITRPSGQGIENAVGSEQVSSGGPSASAASRVLANLVSARLASILVSHAGKAVLDPSGPILPGHLADWLHDRVLVERLTKRIEPFGVIIDQIDIQPRNLIVVVRQPL